MRGTLNIEAEERKRDLILKLNGIEIDAANAASLSGKLCQLANGAIYC